MTRMEMLAAQAAQASLDAHGKLVDPEMAYSFLRDVYADDDEADTEAQQLLGQRSAPIDFIAAYFNAYSDCRTEGCGNTVDDGEGYDGYCGACADQRAGKVVNNSQKGE